MPTESQFRQKLCPALKLLGMKVIPYPGTMRGQTSTCDIWMGGGTPLWQGWIEFKGENTPITDGQIEEQIDLHRKGINAYVVRFVGSDNQVFLISIDDTKTRRVIAAIPMKYENAKGRVVYNWVKCGRELINVLNQKEN